MQTASSVSPTLPENSQAGHGMYKFIIENRLRIALSAFLVLSLISITFNVFQGRAAADVGASGLLFPTGYGFLDVANFALLLLAVVGIAGGFVKFLCYATSAYLSILSVFSAVAFVVSIDAAKQFKADNAKLQRHYDDRAAQVELRDVAKDNYTLAVESRSSNRTMYLDQVKDANETIRTLDFKINKIEEDMTPPSLVVFDRFGVVLPESVSKDAFYLGARLAFVLGIVLVPMVLLTVVASIVAEHKPKKNTPENAPEGTPQNAPENAPEETHPTEVLEVQSGDTQKPKLTLVPPVSAKQYEEFEKEVRAGVVGESPTYKRCISHFDYIANNDQAKEYLHRGVRDGYLTQTPSGRFRVVPKGAMVAQMAQ